MREVAAALALSAETTTLLEALPAVAKAELLKLYHASPHGGGAAAGSDAAAPAKKALVKKGTLKGSRSSRVMDAPAAADAPALSPDAERPASRKKSLAASKSVADLEQFSMVPASMVASGPDPLMVEELKQSQVRHAICRHLPPSLTFAHLRSPSIAFTIADQARADAAHSVQAR